MNALILTTLLTTESEKSTETKPKALSEKEISISTNLRHMIFNRMTHARCLPKDLRIQYNSPKTTGLPETTFKFFKQILVDSFISPVTSKMNQLALKVQNFFTSLKTRVLNQFHHVTTQIKNFPSACKQILLNRVVFPVGSGIKNHTVRIQKALAQKIKNFIGTTCKPFFLNRVISPIGSGIKNLAIKVQNAFNTALDYLLPFDPNPRKASSEESFYDRVWDAYYNGTKEDKNDSVKEKTLVKALSIPKALSKKIKWVSDETVQIAESLKFMKVIKMMHTALNSNLTLASFIQMPRMRERKINRIKHALGIPNPEGEKFLKHINRCERITDTAKIVIYFTVKDIKLAQNVTVVMQTCLKIVENYPEIQNYIPEIPGISTTFRSVNDNLDLAYKGIKDGIFRPCVRRIVMPLIQKALKPLDTGCPKIDLNNTITQYLGNSRMASVTNFLTKKYVEKSLFSTAVDRLDRTENLIADVIISYTVSKVKNIVLQQFTKHLITDTAPTLVLKITPFIKIISPAVHAVAMIAEGGAEQSIGELSVRVSGVAVMVMSGSVFLGTALIYSCFATGHLINLREEYLKENEIEDPIYTNFFENKNAQTENQKQENFDYYQCAISSIASVLFS